jgi:hypothetical protein
MVKLSQRLTDLAHSQRSQDLTKKAKEFAQRPENRRKLEQLRSRLTKKH